MRGRGGGGWWHFSRSSSPHNLAANLFRYGEPLCKIQVYLFVNFVFFTCAYWFIVILFSLFFCKFRCLFLSISFRPLVSVSLLLHLISAFVSFYSFIFSHVLAYFIYCSFSVQWVSAFWSALSAVLLNSLSSSSSFLWPKQFSIQTLSPNLVPHCCIKLS